MGSGTPKVPTAASIVKSAVVGGPGGVIANFGRSLAGNSTIGRIAGDLTGGIGGVTDELSNLGGRPAQPELASAPPPPDPAAAKLSAFDSLAQMLQRRKSMSTLLTGGSGVAGAANTSSPSLQGS